MGAWLADLPWTTIIIVAVIVVVVALAAYLLWRWKKRRDATAGAAPDGPSVSEDLASIWTRFYRRIPSRARHYPTVVVLGEAGVGKSHFIRSRVDWQGQSNQFNHSAYHDAALQLYLGPEVVVHELSAPLLRDVSRRTKRALTRLWRRLGPSTTVVVVLDARSLATTPPADLKSFAQLVRGKIGLFGSRSRESLDVRVAISHLDLVEGYEEFASVVGTHDDALDVELLGPEYTDADRLVHAFDAHMAYALTTREGTEFSRFAGFYDSLAGLVGTLPPVLSALRGEDRFAEQYPPSGLYLGSIVPHSYVGDPFAVDGALVAASVERFNRRHLGGALIVGLASLLFVTGLSVWHYRRITQAEEAVDHLEEAEDDKVAASAEERHAAQDATEAIEHMFDSEVLWLRWMFKHAKHEVERDFADIVRSSHLIPWLEEPVCPEEQPEGACYFDRVQLLHAVSLIYASRDDELGRIIKDNAKTWADQLHLDEGMVRQYVNASRERWSSSVVVPQQIRPSGQEWDRYYTSLCEVFARTNAPPKELARLRDGIPELYSAAHYDVLERVRERLAKDEVLQKRLSRLLVGRLDTEWAATNYEQLESLRDLLAGDLLELEEVDTAGWGLADLIVELERIEVQRQAQPRTRFNLPDARCTFDTGEAAKVVARTKGGLVIHDALENLSYERRGNGKAFFNVAEVPRDVGAIQGTWGGANEVISGYYTKAAFDDHVAPVLDHVDRLLPTHYLTPTDRARLERAVLEIATNYASSYRGAITAYYDGFSFRPGSAVALPYALKPLTQPTSWFTDFMTTVSRNVTMQLPDSPYFEPMARSLEVFAPLAVLLAEDNGTVPGLEPYSGVILELLPLLADSAPADAEAPTGLESKLSSLGKLTLATRKGDEPDRRAAVQKLLTGAGITRDWHHPFVDPIDLVYVYGARNIEREVDKAWVDEVRPVVRPVLSRYPFNPAAEEDATIAEIEGTLLAQGKKVGTFWARFDALIAPATLQRNDRYVMIAGVDAPSGMLDTVADLQDLSNALWDGDGVRVPLPLVITPQVLPKEEYDGTRASAAYLRSGGAAAYAFNQRPEPQTLQFRWWEQETSIVSVKMSAAAEGSGDSTREYTLEEGGQPFSYYHLLDRAQRCQSASCAEISEDTRPLTQWAVARGQACGGTPRGAGGLTVVWAIPLDELGTVTRSVRFKLDTDAWAPFVVRDCP